jgi:hypothetical protein
MIAALTLLTFIHYHASVKAVGWLLARYKAPAPLRESVLGVIHGKWQMRSLAEFGLGDESFTPAAPLVSDAAARRLSSTSP